MCLPTGDWYDWNTVNFILMDSGYGVEVPLEQIPVFVRAGSRNSNSGAWSQYGRHEGPGYYFTNISGMRWTWCVV